MKRLRATGFVSCSLFLSAAWFGCAKQPSAEPLSPSEPNTAGAPDTTQPATDTSDTTESSAPETAPHPSGKRAPCTLGQDQTCNSDPKVSALWGKCLETGVCECLPGFELNPMGSCAPVK